MSGRHAVVTGLVSLVVAGCGSGGETAPSTVMVARGLTGDWLSCVEAASCPGGALRIAWCAGIETGDGGAGDAFDCLVELDEGDATVVRVACDGETCRWEPPWAPGDTGLPGDTATPFAGSFPVSE